MPLEKVISPRQVKTAYMLVLEKGPSSFLFIKGDRLSQEVRKKYVPALAGRCNTVYWEQNTRMYSKLQTQSWLFSRPERRKQLHSP